MEDFKALAIQRVKKKSILSVGNINCCFSFNYFYHLYHDCMYLWEHFNPDETALIWLYIVMLNDNWTLKIYENYIFIWIQYTDLLRFWHHMSTLSVDKWGEHPFC